MDVITLETAVARTVSLHCNISAHLHGVQGLLVSGAPDGGREAYQVVQGPVHRYVLVRSSNRFLLFSGLPITFLLGLYVSLVVKRWWEQYCLLPWPDTIAIYLKGLVVGDSEEKRVVARMVRRTVIHYQGWAIPCV